MGICFAQTIEFLLPKGRSGCEAGEQNQTSHREELIAEEGLIQLVQLEVAAVVFGEFEWPFKLAHI